MPFMLVYCIEKNDHNLFCLCFQVSTSHYWILLYIFEYIWVQYFLWGNLLSTDSMQPFKVWTWALSLSVQSGHTFHSPKGQQIVACLSHTFINLCRLGSCYFIPESPCPKMPEILLPFHSVNQNWKLLSHRTLICQLAAACRAILLWIIWKASLGPDPQRDWEPPPCSWTPFGGVKWFCRVAPVHVTGWDALCCKGWQVSHWPEEEQD